MATAYHNFTVADEYKRCFEEVSRLINSQSIRIGYFYDWPVKYGWAWDDGDIQDAVTSLLSSCNMNWQANGSGVVIISL